VVSDGELERTAYVGVIIEPKYIPAPPPPPPDGEEEEDEGGVSMMMVIGVLVVLVIIGAVMGLMVARKREQRIEAAEMAREDEVDQRESLERMAAAVKATADQMEAELGASRAGAAASGAAAAEGAEGAPVEARLPGGEAAMLTAEGMEGRLLTMRPQETEAASKETRQLFESAPTASVEDQERLRVDNLKRKYATAIGRLPYGIPAADLKGMDWNDLAAALATGQKKTLPDGHETTQVKGKWYYSDPSDSSTFLKEHGARPKAEPGRAAATGAAAPKVDKSALLEKLEERFILG